MKKKWIGIVIVAAVVALVAAAIGVRYWRTSPGVRVVNGALHVNVQKTGYVFDSETGELVGQTAVTVNGATSETNGKEFAGELMVLAYQNSASGTISRTAALEKTDGGFYTIRVLETCTHFEEDDKNITKEVEHILDYSYLYCIYPENPEFLTVVVEDLEASSAYYVVCADSEEQARKDHRWFLENKPK